MPPDTALTARQQAWFQSVASGLERETGRSMAEWAEIARSCPETRHRARLAWFKEHHGLGQNRASVILEHAFPAAAEAGGSDPVGLLWTDPDARALFELVREHITTLPEVVVGQRKAYTPFSRKVQFAAARPAGSGLILGLAVPPDAPLEPPGRASWSERLTSQVRISAAEEIAPLQGAIRQAWERS